MSKIETTTEPAKLEELLATIQKIHDRIMVIGGRSPDDSPYDLESGPESEPQESDGDAPDQDEDDEPEEETEGLNQVDPDCDDAAETEDDDDSTELIDGDPLDEYDPAALPPEWEFYGNEMENLEISG